MRLYTLFSVAGVAMAAGPAFAACGDPGSSPSVVGKTYIGSDMNFRAKARRPTLSNRILFNADCTTTQTIGNGGGTKAFKGTWSQVGQDLKFERSQPGKGGRPAQIGYVAVVAANGQVFGKWGEGADITQDFEMNPAKDAFPCGAPGAATDLAGSTFKGTLVSPEGVTVPMELELNTNCTAFMFGLNYAYSQRWKQTGGKLTFKTQGRGWISTLDGDKLKGKIILVDNWMVINPFVPQADWGKVPQADGVPGEERGTFVLTRDK